jgi:hypothetical protein
VDGRRGARRRWPWISAIAILVIALVATGFAAFHERASAQDWKSSAQEWKSSANNWQSQAQALAKKSKQQAAKIKDQQERLTNLAAEKASVEDEREQQRQAATALAEFADLYRDAGAKLQNCVATWQRFTGDLVANMYNSVDLSGEAASGDQICNDAFNAYNRTEDLLQRIQNG